VGGWDPVHRPSAECQRAHIVNLGYVVNVIEQPDERTETLRRAWALTETVLIVGARLDWEANTVPGHQYSDGILTSKGTFQKLFSQDELRAWVDDVLGVRSVAAAPGIFYVFRNEIGAQSFLATRVRRRSPAVRRPRIDRIIPRQRESAAIRRQRANQAMYEANRDVLEPLARFLQSRGRTPESFELPEAAAAADRFGSVKAALAALRSVTADEVWEKARASAMDDLIVYLALAAFGGRPKFTNLPPDIQLDVKAFFGSYKEACAAADTVLFGAGNQRAIDQACRQAAVGKLTREALYLHVSALPWLGPLLRVYEGCGRALTGTVEEATLVKLNRVEPKISYLAYPDFDRDPHPALTMSVRADLRRLDVRIRNFREWPNPPILHRKETFVRDDYPGREKFARLTRQEERASLLTDTATIGTRDRWKALVKNKGLRLLGHRLTRDNSKHPNP
jgi:DNA phosphorothioation-associated putative methyltransferase